MGRYRRSWPAVAACALTVLAVSVACARDGKAARAVSVITHWSPQAQFAGCYVAQEKGFYRERGLAVEFLPSGPDISASQALADGRADIAVLWLSQALQNSSRGVDLITIGQIVQHSGLMFVARRSGGIREPADLDGKKVSMWEGDLRLQGEAFVKKYGLRVRTICQSYTVNLFLAGGVDAVMAMWYNEYHSILHAGVDPEELSVFFMKDHGFNVPEDGLYMLRSRYRNDPSLAKDFAEATLAGWAYAFDHPDEAVDIVLSRMRAAKIPANREHQKWMLKTIESLIAPNGDRSRMGALSPDDYRAVAGALRESGLIDGAPEYDLFAATSYAEK